MEHMQNVNKGLENKIIQLQQKLDTKVIDTVIVLNFLTLEIFRDYHMSNVVLPGISAQ